MLETYEMKKLILYIPFGVLSVLITALIAYISLANNPFDINDVPLFKGADKLIHGIMYFGCVCVYMFDYAKFKLPHKSGLNVELALTTTAIVVGLLMEVAQMVLNTGRTFDLMDWGADSIGAIIGFLFMHFFYLHYVRKSLTNASIKKRYHSRHSHSHHHKSEENDNAL